jgi:hypothetical protein
MIPRISCRRAARARPLAAFLLGLAACGAGDEPADAAGPWHEGPRLPAPVSNNAAAAVVGPRGITVLSFLGIDSTKSPGGVTNAAYRWDVTTDELEQGDLPEAWRRIAPVPGPGRLAPAVQVFGGRVFLFGGYTVAEDGTERSVPNVDVYTPFTDTWAQAAGIPLPVDDAVSGVWASELIYLVSGWHDDGNVADVQMFDPSLNRWTTATPIPGEPVFGHAGAIMGGDIVYVGGAKVVEGRPRFAIDSTAWRGRIDPVEPSRIEWEAIRPPPGPPFYRAASGVLGGRVVLLGGTDNPYNYDGVGYDGTPSEPSRRLIAYDRSDRWIELPPPPVATMDHRTLAVAGGWVFVVGGMTEGQRVDDRVWYARADELLAAGGAR